MELVKRYNIYKELIDNPKLLNLFSQVIEDYINEYYNYNIWIDNANYVMIIEKVLELAIMRAQFDALDNFKNDIDEYVKKKYDYYKDLLKDTLTKQEN